MFDDQSPFSLPEFERTVWRRYRLCVKLRRVMFFLFRVISAGGLFILVIATLTQLSFTLIVHFYYDEDPTTETPALFNISRFMVLLSLFLLQGLGALYTYPKVDIILLRPFGKKRSAKNLRRLTLRYLSSLGYVFTLSDKNFAGSGFVWIASIIYGFVIRLLLNPVLRREMICKKIECQADYDVLCAGPNRKQSYLNMMCGGQALAVKSTDEWWTFCVNIWLQTSYLIIVDLSYVKPGTEYELGEIHRFGLNGKCIFISDVKYEATARALLAKYLSAEDPILFLFDSKGIVVSNDLFKGKIDQIIRARTRQRRLHTKDIDVCRPLAEFPRQVLLAPVARHTAFGWIPVLPEATPVAPHRLSPRADRDG